MFDGSAFDGIGKMLTGLAIAVVVLAAWGITSLFFIGGDDVIEVETTEKIEPASIEITQEGDTLYHYHIEVE